LKEIRNKELENRQKNKKRKAHFLFINTNLNSLGGLNSDIVD